MSRSGILGARPVVGILGGIGAGKSRVAAELEALGWARVDADAIGHELLADPAVRRAVRRRWGAGVFGPGGQVDRKALAEIVFADPAELEALNALMHPRIRRRMARRIRRARADARVAGVVVDAAVLLEAGWDDLCTHLVFVSAPDRLRARRAASDRGWTRRDWRRREKSQISLDIKAARCDYKLENSSSASRLREQVRLLNRQLVHAAG